MGEDRPRVSAVGWADLPPDGYERVEGPPVDSVRPPVDPPEGTFVGVATGDLVDEARKLEYEVFLEKGYCEPSADGRIREYAPWEDRSEFHVVVDPQGRLTAALRTTVDVYERLPVGKFERLNGYPDGVLTECASLMVPAWARGQAGTEALYRSVVMSAVRRGDGGMVAIGEDWLLEFLNGAYDFGFSRLGPSHWYMGGECFALGVSMSDFLDNMRARQPSFADWFITEVDLRSPAPAALPVPAAPVGPTRPMTLGRRPRPAPAPAVAP